LATLTPDNRSSLRIQDYECQAQQFQSNDQHGRATLKQVSAQNFQHGVGVLFYTENDPQGRQRYEGQIKNSLPGKQNKVQWKRLNVITLGHN
jgi:hypothetical protein